MKQYTDWILFLDDERYPVNYTNTHIARSTIEAIDLCKQYGLPREILFDHDLGGEDTSIKFIQWLEDSLLDGLYTLSSNFTYSIHSQNPIGAKNIQCRMDNLIKYFTNT